MQPDFAESESDGACYSSDYTSIVIVSLRQGLPCPALATPVHESSTANTELLQVRKVIQQYRLPSSLFSEYP
jgi:hypothetical protein